MHTPAEDKAPCYLYEEASIRSACQELKKNLPGFSFLYSIKTNPFEPVVRTVCEEGFGADAASVREVLESRACGIPAERIFFSAPGRTAKDFRSVWGQCLIVADSLHELDLLQEIAAGRQVTVEVGIRVHPLFVMGEGSRSPSKFGIDLEDLPALKQKLLACPNLKVVGMHVHLKSQVLDTDVIAQYYKDVFQTAQMLEEECGLHFRFLNFGSGIGVTYDALRDHPVDLERLQALTKEMQELNAKTLKAELIIESGRFVICKAGRYLTRIVDKKVSQGRTYLIVTNGMNGFLRPALASLVAKVSKGQPVGAMEPLYTGSSEFELHVLNDNPRQETVTVVGNLCTAMDVIASDVTLNAAEIGDVIEITNAGSYAYSLSVLTFSSQPLPGQYLHTTDDQYLAE